MSKKMYRKIYYTCFIHLCIGRYYGCGFTAVRHIANCDVTYSNYVTNINLYVYDFITI